MARVGDNAALMHGRAFKILAAIVIVLAVAFPFFLALRKFPSPTRFGT